MDNTTNLILEAFIALMTMINYLIHKRDNQVPGPKGGSTPMREVVAENRQLIGETHTEVKSINGQTTAQNVENLGEQMGQNPVTPPIALHDQRREPSG